MTAMKQAKRACARSLHHGTIIAMHERPFCCFCSLWLDHHIVVVPDEPPVNGITVGTVVWTGPS